MINVINGETPFQILSSSFSIGPSETGYELQVGADSRNFTTLFSVGANTPRMVTNVANGSYFRLKNNVGDVKVNWQRVCVNEGGEGGSGTELQPVADFPLNAVEGTVISYTGSSSASGVYQYDGTEWTEVGSDVDLSAYWTSAETKTYVDSAVTDTQNQLNEISGMMQSKELVISTAFNQLSDEIDELSGRSVDLSAYYTSAQTEEAISAATSGKADAANIAANTGNYIFPKWNNQGIISGVSQQVFESYLLVNDEGTGGYFFMNTSKYDAQNKALKLYTPLSAGTAGDILVSTGNGAPVWSAVTMPEVKTVIDFDRTTQSERAAVYAELKTLYDAGSGGTINKKYDFYKTVNTWQGLKIEYYTFSGGSLVFGKVVSPGNLTEQIVYEQVMTIDAAGNVAVVTNTVGGGADMSAYWTSAQTEDAIAVVQNQVDIIDEVVSDALNDLNAQLTTRVSSTSVSTIWRGTQAEYDAITTKDANTFYIITGTNN